MALEATHIRFAIDVEDRFDVEDEAEYVSGSVYPDSRYMTGIGRAVTHDESHMRISSWQGNDFRKGWASHLLYDIILNDVHKERFAHLLRKDGAEMSVEEQWVVFTALKVLQDMDDVQHYDIQTYLGALAHVEMPNDEDQQTMQSYNNLFVDMYGRTPNTTIETYEHMFTALGAQSKTAERVCSKARALAQDVETMALVRAVYPETLQRTKAYFDRCCI